MGAMERLKEAKGQRSAKRASIELQKEQKDFDELFKKLDDFAIKGYQSVSKEDKDFFLKSFGIFDRPATPQTFMLRVRIPAGAVNCEQAKAISNIAIRYGDDQIDITARMQIQLRGLFMEDIPAILKELEAVGLTTYQTGVDNFRNIISDPLFDSAKDSMIDTKELVLKIQEIFLKKPEWISSLPRKFNIAILGSRTDRCNVFGQDCAFILAKKEGRLGFNIYLGGKVGAKAKSADIFVGEQEVASAFEAIASLFREYGFRDDRNKNRLKFLIEAVGMEGFADAIRQRAGINFSKAGDLLVDMKNDESKIPIRLKDGSYALHFAIPAGALSGKDLALIADFAKESGNGKIRFTVEQNLYVLGVKEPSNPDLNEAVQKYVMYENNFLTNVSACSGKGRCLLGLIPSKSAAVELAKSLYKTTKYKDTLRMYWSACPKGCGLHLNADVGFVGAKRWVDGHSEFAVDIYLGKKFSKIRNEKSPYMRGVLLRDLNEIVSFLLSQEN